MRGIAVIGVVGAFAVALVPAAAAQPGSGPRETIDETFTATQPGTPTGLAFTGSYHAAGDPQGNPPYMRRMEFVPPAGMRFDTTAPARCTATDVQLQAFGPQACPAASLIGTGTTDGIFYEPVVHAFVVDRFHHTVDVVNGPDQQIMLVRSEGYTVVRGRMQPDGTTDFAGPTCVPAPPAGGCADDYVLQLGSSITIPAYTRQGRSYATTPPTCPASGRWRTTVRFWWADGTADSVVSRQPCA